LMANGVGWECRKGGRKKGYGIYIYKDCETEMSIKVKQLIAVNSTKS